MPYTPLQRRTIVDQKRRRPQSTINYSNPRPGVDSWSVTPRGGSSPRFTPMPFPDSGDRRPYDPSRDLQPTGGSTANVGLGYTSGTTATIADEPYVPWTPPSPQFDVIGGGGGPSPFNIVGDPMGGGGSSSVDEIINRTIRDYGRTIGGGRIRDYGRTMGGGMPSPVGPRSIYGQPGGQAPTSPNPQRQRRDPRFDAGQQEWLNSLSPADRLKEMMMGIRAQLGMRGQYDPTRFSGEQSDWLGSLNSGDLLRELLGNLRRGSPLGGGQGVPSPVAPAPLVPDQGQNQLPPLYGWRGSPLDETPEQRQLDPRFNLPRNRFQY